MELELLLKILFYCLDIAGIPIFYPYFAAGFSYLQDSRYFLISHIFWLEQCDSL